MNAADRDDYVSRYEKMPAEFGDSPRALGWGKHCRQDIRFGVLADHVLRRPETSVLDVGFGLADLYPFLTERSGRGGYTGIDLVPGLLRVARERHPQLDLRQLDLAQEVDALEPHDFVVASGIFKARLRSGDNRRHIREMLAAMFRVARVAVCVDFLHAVRVRLVPLQGGPRVIAERV